MNWESQPVTTARPDEATVEAEEREWQRRIAICAGCDCQRQHAEYEEALQRWMHNQGPKPAGFPTPTRSLQCWQPKGQYCCFECAQASPAWQPRPPERAPLQGAVA